MLKNLIRKFVPNFILSWYHLLLAHLANFFYFHPSEKLIVIGVTGTKGKSTTVNLIAKILEEAGNKVVISSTVKFSNGKNVWLNDLKMTMPGRFFLQRLLSRGVANGAKYAVIESSSEGILQHRQIGIHYDAMVFTNLTPEHMEAHGGFENYKEAKQKYFEFLANSPHKILQGQKIEKVIAANLDDPHGCDFMLYHVDKKIGFGKNGDLKIKGSDLAIRPEGISFKINGQQFDLKLKGAFDFYNALAAVALTSGLGIVLNTAKQALEKMENVPGRMELIEKGQPFKVIVDYAHEPEGMRQLYATIKNWPHGKIIQVWGPTGGGRDQARRPIMGKLAADNVDTLILTTDDPYNDDPAMMIEEVATGAPDAVKILDRREAIAKALQLAQPNDLVLITGKGAEQKMAIKNGYIDWDDREVVREELKKLIK